MLYLVDGNNLMFALSGVGIDAGRSNLCHILGRFAAAGVGAGAIRPEEIRVVFDGPPPGPLDPQARDCRLDIAYSGTRKADELLINDIERCYTARRLTVVSSDHEIRQAARRRRCVIVGSEDFARLLSRVLRGPARPAVPEPGQKTAGLSPGETDEWLKLLDLDDEQVRRDDELLLGQERKEIDRHGDGK